MKKPIGVLIGMLSFLFAVALIGAMLYVPLQRAFAANPILNGVIFTVFAWGVIANIRQVLALLPEIDWIDAFRSNDAVGIARAPLLLASMAKLLIDKTGQGLSLSALAMHSLLEGIRSRLDEARSLSRYLIGLLIFLGLLGTFWGLLNTLASVGAVIDGLGIGPGADIGVLFDKLKSGLKAPLAGMGISFSSSLFGLAGSLILGFLDLQAGRAQNRFLNDLEEWLAEVAHLPSASRPGDGELQSPMYIEALLEHTAQNLDRLQQNLARGEEERNHLSLNLLLLGEKIEGLINQLRSEQEILIKLVERQPSAAGSFGADTGLVDAALHRLSRVLTAHLDQVSTAMTQDRTLLIQEIQSELRALNQSIATLTDRTQPQQRIKL
ncbi:MAG: flagellar motor protein MotA [Gammaproteobacteria bacterium]